MCVEKSFLKIVLVFIAVIFLNGCGGSGDSQPTDLQISTTAASFTVSQASGNLTQSMDYEITWKSQDVAFLFIGVLDTTFPSWLRFSSSDVSVSPVSMTMEVDATGLAIGRYTATASIVSNKPNYVEIERITFPVSLNVVQ